MCGNILSQVYTQLEAQPQFARHMSGLVSSCVGLMLCCLPHNPGICLPVDKSIDWVKAFGWDRPLRVKTEHAYPIYVRCGVHVP